MDIPRILAQIAFVLAMVSLALVLSGCAPQLEDYNEVCMGRANQALLERYYQPGHPGFRFRDARHSEVFLSCRQDKIASDRRERTEMLAPLVAIGLGAASGAIIQTNPRVLLYP